MVILTGKPIAMPRPFGGVPPVITVTPKGDTNDSGKYIAVQISGVITSVYQFLEFQQVLKEATEKDTVDVFIDTPGGCVFTTQLLVEWMNSSKATVTAVASGLVASAGTFLWFFSKNRRVDNWATFMFHSSSHGDFGKSLAIHENSKEMVTYMDKIVKAMIAKGILTAEEAGKIFAQKKDLFVSGKVIRARMLDAMASTEGLRLVNEDDPTPGEGSVNDHPTDPDGNPDQDADDGIDGDTTEVAKPVDPAAIFRAEGVEEGEGDAQPGEGDGEGDGDGQPGEGEGDGAPAEGKCGRGKKAKKAAKKGGKKPKAEGEGEGEGDAQPGEGEGEGDGEPGSEENPVDPAEATSMTSFLKW